VGRRSSSSGRSSSGRRGFGGMPREEMRRIASKGGRARWGEEENDRGRGRRTSNRGRSRGR
jgi:general stress protein YciG